MVASTTPASFSAEPHADSAPDRFECLSVIELTPDDIRTTPPVTATLYMSPTFTNPDGADAERGKTRDYVLVLEYPDGVENTVVRMDDCPTVHGSRMFRRFVEKMADERGYTTESVDVCERIEG